MKRGLVLISLIFIVLFLSVFVSAITITGRVGDNPINPKIVTLNSGSSVTLSINGITHIINLTSVISNQALLTFDGSTVVILVGATQQVNGLNVTIDSVYPTSNFSGSATILISPSCAIKVGCEAANFMGWRAADCSWGNLTYCPSGCSDGACITAPTPQATCTETDNGLDLAKKGTATDKNGNSFTDYCYSDGNTLREYFCNPGDTVTSGEYDCKYLGYGGGCYNGACVNITSSSTNQSIQSNESIIPPNYYTNESNPSNITETVTSCIHSWNCSDWTPSDCSASETQTRQCNDLNGCITFSNITDVRECNSNISSPQVVNNAPTCISGCLYQDKCLPYGYRVGSNYCNLDNTLKEQNSNGACDNNFECVSNLCANSQCISPSFLQQIINFFKNLFGIQ
jgi:hypothetical protein